jgi:DNA-3-methyladenine glycosylase
LLRAESTESGAAVHTGSVITGPASALLDVIGRRAPEAAADLLGWRLTHRTSEGVVTVELTEVEAYDGEQDPASHAGRGRTPRNAIMYGPPGAMYVYFSYGMHWCANIVCGPEGQASAVLLRAGRVVDGEDLARVRRGPRVAERSLARGPACLTQALGIGRAQNGADLVHDPAYALAPPSVSLPPAAISSGPRVGVTLAPDVPWRFWRTGDSTVSTYKRSPRAPAAPSN